MGTIILPILISSIHLAINNPRIVFNKWDEEDPKKIMGMRIGVILLSFLNPVLIINAYETLKQKITEMVRENDANTTPMLNKCRKIKKQYVDFIRIELGLESIYQTIGQVLLILLARTLTRTTSGFQQMFVEEEDESMLERIARYAHIEYEDMTENFVSFGSFNKIIFYLSIFIGLKCCITEKVKGISVEKVVLGTPAKIVLHLWALFATFRKVVSVVVFFVPSMGLFSLLYHWRAENVPIAAAKSVKPNATLELFNLTEPLKWSDISRWNRTDPDHPIPPPYTLYTGISLGGTFKVFLGIMAVHFISVALVKIFTVRSFRKENLFNCFVDILENMNVPSP